MKKINCNSLALTCREDQRAHDPDVMIDSSRKRSRSILKLAKSPFPHVKPTQRAAKIRLWKLKLSAPGLRGFNALSEVRNFSINYMIQSRRTAEEELRQASNHCCPEEELRRAASRPPYTGLSVPSACWPCPPLTLTDRHQRQSDALWV